MGVYKNINSEEKMPKRQEEQLNHIENSLNIIDKIVRSFNKIDKTQPSIGFGINFINSNQFYIFCATYENYLQDPERKNKSMKEASANIDLLLKKLKENLKNDFDITLKVKLISENSDVECISLNGRYKLTHKKMYEIIE